VYGELRVASLNYLPDVTVKLPLLRETDRTWADRVFAAGGHSQLLLWRLSVDRSRPPVDGSYRVREDETVLRFALTVNVHPPVKNVTVQIPFGARGALTKHAFQNPGGQLKLSKKPEPTLLWARRSVKTDP
jgi:hypothetical protein